MMYPNFEIPADCTQLTLRRDLTYSWHWNAIVLSKSGLELDAVRESIKKTVPTDHPELVLLKIAGRFKREQLAQEQEKQR